MITEYCFSNEVSQSIQTSCDKGEKQEENENLQKLDSDSVGVPQEEI